MVHPSYVSGFIQAHVISSPYTLVKYKWTKINLDLAAINQLSFPFFVGNPLHVYNLHLHVFRTSSSGNPRFGERNNLQGKTPLKIYDFLKKKQLQKNSLMIQDWRISLYQPAKMYNSSVVFLSLETWVSYEAVAVFEKARGGKMDKAYLFEAGTCGDC